MIKDPTMSSHLYDPHMSSVNPSAATKKAIRRSFRFRAAAYWNPFRSISKHTSTDSSSGQESVEGEPSNSMVLPKVSSFRKESKGNGNITIVRAMSSETLLTTMDCVDASVAQTDLRSNLLRAMQEDDESSIDSFVSESVDDEDSDEDSEEELVSVVWLEFVHSSHDLDHMSEISEVSADVDGMEDDDSAVPWMPEPTHAESILLPSGEI